MIDILVPPVLSVLEPYAIVVIISVQMKMGCFKKPLHFSNLCTVKENHSILVKVTDLFSSDLFYLTKNILTLKHYLVFFERDFVLCISKASYLLPVERGLQPFLLRIRYRIN